MSKPTKEFVNLITELAAGFDREADEAMFAAYWIALYDLTSEAVRVGVHGALRSAELNRMPRPGELRELCGVLTPRKRAVLAFDALQGAVEKIGSYGSVDFDDLVINATVRNLGGWERVCLIPAKEFDSFFRRDFERIYISLCETGITPESAKPLLGYYAKENHRNGHDPQPPKKVLTGMPKNQVKLLGSGGRQKRIGGDVTLKLKKAE